MKTMESLSSIIIETLRELSDNQLSLSVVSLSKALNNRSEVTNLLAPPKRGSDGEPQTGEPRAQSEELRSRLLTLHEQRRKQLHELEEFQRQHLKICDLSKRALHILVTMLLAHEEGATAMALHELRQKLKGEIEVELLEESLQTLKHLVLREEVDREPSNTKKPERATPPVGTGSPGGSQQTSLAEAYFEQLQSVYMAIIESLQSEADVLYAERASALLSRVIESKNIAQLLALNPEIIVYLQDYGRTLGEERSQITSFITGIGANLADLERHFLSSLSLDTQEKESNSTFNALLSGEMEEMKNRAELSRTLAELKEAVSARIAAIAEAIEQKRIEDNLRWEAARNEKESLERNLQSIKREIETVQARTKALELEMLLDPLTGVHNRRAYEQRLKQEMKRFRRYGHLFSLLILDIDHFKHINDHYGHAVGDQCLKRMVRRLKPILRETDLLARYGGEEFVVLLPGTNCANAYHVGEKLRLSLAHTRFEFRGHDIPFTISVGVSEVRASDESEEALFQRADEAIYQAKRSGRNRTVAL